MKKNGKVYLGFDLGAGSGRAVLGFLEKNKLRIEEIHRFSNGPVLLGNTLYWNFLGLWSNIVESLRLCSRRGITDLSGIGVDTWGVDFGLLSRDGRLLSNPVHYRDRRTEGIEKVLSRIMPDEEIYRRTGLRIGRVTTLSQLAAMNRSNERGQLESAKTFLMMSDLLRYFLCGKKGCELTAVGSSELADVKKKQWSTEIFRAFDLPLRIMPKIVRPGTTAGNLREEIRRETGMRSAPVIVTAGHDTASAAAAVPFRDPETAFVSCGTWACLGVVNDKPITSPKAREYGFINEFGLDSMLIIKNLTGLYLVETLRREWMKKDKPISYEQMTTEARKAEPFAVYIDTNAPRFFAGDNLENSLISFLHQTKQKASINRGRLIRAILEGLAFNFRKALMELSEITGRTLKRLCIVGGGAHNSVLCRMAADATGLEVIAGPAEATVMGNLGIQALAGGELKSPSDIRTLIRNSTPLMVYKPRLTSVWSKQFEEYLKIVKQSKTLSK